MSQSPQLLLDETALNEIDQAANFIGPVIAAHSHDEDTDEIAYIIATRELTGEPGTILFDTGGSEVDPAQLAYLTDKTVNLIMAVPPLLAGYRALLAENARLRDRLAQQGALPPEPLAPVTSMQGQQPGTLFRNRYPG